MQLSDLNRSDTYSYADCYIWTFDERVELIKGKIFDLPTPGTLHQRVSGSFFVAIANWLEGKYTEVFAAPFDVRLPIGSNKDDDIFTVIQPDLCVICDPEKIDGRGCLGAPDIVIEILSPGNNKKEVKNKFDVYEEAGVHEYWIIHPEEKTFLKYKLENGRFVSSRLLTLGDDVTTEILPGLKLSLDKLFFEKVS